ncbi:MAG: beta-galactosidase [Kiritimatiellae bacterium]|nr:beta-galactosidase [Kiritimatiellia bacterium]
MKNATLRHPLNSALMLGMVLILAMHTASGAHAARGQARMVQTVDGYDWWLPSYVRMTPYSGYITKTEWGRDRLRLQRFQDGHVHRAEYVTVTWNEVNPAEDVYDWDFVDRKIREATAEPGTGYMFWIVNYSETHPNWRPERPQRPAIPPWVVAKGNVKFLSNNAVAAWEPGCGYQKYFGKMLRALGARYKDDPKLVAVDMRGLDCHHGEWCWRGGRGDGAIEEAETRTGLTPESVRAWGIRFVDDFVEGFAGQEKKLVWPNGTHSFIPRRGTKHDYGPASRAIRRHAYERGCGGRDGKPSLWLKYIGEGYGSRLTKEGYLEFDEDFAPVRTGAMWYTENSEYFPDGKGSKEFGGEKHHRLRWFVTTMRVLQMRRNWQWVPSIIAQFEEFDPAFMRWVDYSMGKNRRTSPDAWSWLREGYLSEWSDFRPVKNFERWLLQRDVDPDGRTVPAAKVDISELKYNYTSGKGYEFHARRTDRAGGSAHIYLQADPVFGAGGPRKVMLKVTYLDGPATRWRIEYTGRDGAASSETVETTGSGNWQTSTFEIPDMRFARAFRDQMDFRITSLGPADLTVKLVRLIKAEAP